MNAPKIVAEISANHNGSLDNAVRLIYAAKAAGADAVKLQTYRPDSITIDHDGPGFVIDNGPWQGRRLYDLYRDAMTPWGWHAPLFDCAHEIGIECFSSPFDRDAVDLLAGLNCPAYKIASFEIIDLELIRHAACQRRPMIISTGMASEDEIADALGAARDAASVTLLHCVSDYPAEPKDAHLQRIRALRMRFGVPVGLSDHTLGIVVPIAAAALGATMIEKHLTLRRSDGGPDSAFSLEPLEFKMMVQAVREAAVAAAAGSPPEPYRGLRRSLYAVADIAAGETITERNVRAIRPGLGLAPKRLAELLGKRAVMTIARGTPMMPELVR